MILRPAATSLTGFEIPRVRMMLRCALLALWSIVSCAGINTRSLPRSAHAVRYDADTRRISTAAKTWRSQRENSCRSATHLTRQRCSTAALAAPAWSRDTAAAATRRRCSIAIAAALAWTPRGAFAFDVTVGPATGDVLYPASLVGEWRCARVLTAVDGDSVAAEGAWRSLGGGAAPFVAGRTEAYSTRFVAPATPTTYTFEGRAIEGVVLDRAFELDRRRREGAATWDPRAPSIVRDGDATLTVVSRTSEISEAGFGFDELIRVDAAAGGLIGGAARVSRLIRCKRRYRRAFAEDGRRVVEGLEIVKTYRVLDGVAEADLPTSSAKYTLRLERGL